MINLFLLFLFHSIFLASSCPTGWQSANVVQGKCYLFVTKKDTWFQAENYCKNAAADGHLTSIQSAFENSEVYGYALQQCDQYWVGLDDIEQTGHFNWIDERPLQYTNWDAGQPNLADNNQCVSLNGKGNGKWITEICGKNNCFICETFQSSITTTPTTTRPSTSPSNMTDCYDWYTIGGIRSDGIYQIRVPGITNPLAVWCDMTTDGGGWTVFQRRINGDLPFYDKTWHDYKYGFNDGLDKNLWLGNEYIHLLSTKDANVDLRIDIWGDRAPNSTYPNIYLWLKQSPFYLDKEANNYTLHASKTVQGNASISGSSSTGISYNIGNPFSTIDNNHDIYNGNCNKPPQDLGGWWFGTGGCTYSSLNGKYIPSGWQQERGFAWYSGNSRINPAQSRMMIRKTT